MTIAFTVSIDVPEIDAGVAFYTHGLGFVEVGKLDPSVAELTFAGVRVFLLEKERGTKPHSAGVPRHYERHWTPVHLDLEVDDLERAIRSAVEAGAVLEHTSSDPKWGDIAMLADPFGNGFCLIKPVPAS